MQSPWYPSFSGNAPQGFSNYTRYMDRGWPGILEGTNQALVGVGLNNVSNPDIITLTPPSTPDNSTLYSLSISDGTVSDNTGLTTYTTVSSSSPSDLMQGLYNAMQEDPVFWSLAQPSINSSTNVITLTGRSAVVSLTVTQTSTNTNNIAIAKTSTASKNGMIPFGRFVGYQSSYPVDSIEGVPGVTLVNAASGFTVYGVTLLDYLTEQAGLFQNAQDGYNFGVLMQVVQNTGLAKGMWVDTVESNLTLADASNLSICTSNSANYGMLTRATSGNVNISSNVTLVIPTTPSQGRNITLLRFKFP